MSRESREIYPIRICVKNRHLRFADKLFARGAVKDYAFLFLFMQTYDRLGIVDSVSAKLPH